MFYDLLKKNIHNSHRRSLKRGEIVYHEGDRPESLYLIDEGLVGLFHISENGKETFLRVFNQNDIFGHRSLFAETPYHATSVALTKTDLTIISKEQFVVICQANQHLLKDMTQLLATNLGDAELRLAGLQDKTAGQRIIEALVYLKLKHPNHTWTRKEIAEFSGSTLETVTRVMTKLTEKNYIKKIGRDFEILNFQELLHYSKSDI